MATFVIAFGTLWPMLLGTIHGVSDLHPRLIETTRILQMSKLLVIFKVALPRRITRHIGWYAGQHHGGTYSIRGL